MSTVTALSRPQPAAQLWTIRKVAPTAIEMVLLAEQISDAVKRFEIATQDENYGRVVSAVAEIDDALDRFAFLSGSTAMGELRMKDQEYKR